MYLLLIYVQVLKDWHLALGVLLLVSIDLTILLLYTTVKGVQSNLTATRVPNQENSRSIEGVGMLQHVILIAQQPFDNVHLPPFAKPCSFSSPIFFLLQELGITTIYYTYVCNSTSRNIFLGILYGYKLVLQVVILAFTSLKVKVKIKGLNDAKYIAAATSATSIVLAVIIFTTYTLRNFVNVFSALICTGLFIGTTSILGLVFVPKVRWLVIVSASKFVPLM